jgi:hypothetical protein
MSDDRVKAAEFEVDRSRAALISTLQDVSRQFEPHRLVQEAWDKAKDKGADLAEEAVNAVSKRPVAAGAVVAGIVAFIAREPLIDLARKLADGSKGKSRRRRKPALSRAEGAPNNEKTEATE